MKAVWTGAITFGLVTIPIKLYSATSSKKTKFRLLHATDKAPIRYKRVCSAEGVEVPWDQIVKGLEVGKDEYVAFSQEELDALKPEKSDTVDLVEFVPAAQLDPIHFDRHYFVAPTRKRNKPFFLFKEVLQQSARVAIGRFVMREKEYVCAIESYKSGLRLTTLNYAYEIRDPDVIEELAEPPELSSDERLLAEQLIDKLTKDEFAIEAYEDTYEEQLQALIAERETGRVSPAAEPLATREDDLLAALKASLEA